MESCAADCENNAGKCGPEDDAMFAVKSAIEAIVSAAKCIPVKPGTEVEKPQ